MLTSAKLRFLQIADDYTWLNSHLTLAVDWFGKARRLETTDAAWPKWRPSDPTSAHWYEPQHLERLIAAYLAHDEDLGRARTVREVVAEFRGFSGSAAQKKVLDATGLARAPLSALPKGAVGAPWITRLLDRRPTLVAAVGSPTRRHGLPGPSWRAARPTGRRRPSPHSNLGAGADRQNITRVKMR